MGAASESHPPAEPATPTKPDSPTRCTDGDGDGDKDAAMLKFLLARLAIFRMTKIPQWPRVGAPKTGDHSLRFQGAFGRESNRKHCHQARSRSLKERSRRREATPVPPR